MRNAEIKATGALAAEALGGTGALVRDVHRAASKRVFGALGGIAAPVRVMHDGISSAVFSSVRLGLRAIPAGAGRALALAAAPDAPALGESPHGSVVLGALNGAYGDRLAGGPLGVTMELRGDREATGTVVVFVHGLGETDASWRFGGRPSYGERLREELGHTPLYARYNTGRHISDNGRALALALAEVDADELVLVGHSMGGLVIRSALHYGEPEWTSRVKHVFCLGSPHMGAPLERAANLGGHHLRRLPETAPFARLFDVRSSGIKDLRFGSCLEEDWLDRDPDGLVDECGEVPFLPGATYYYVGATLTRDKDHPVARAIGDLLVQFPSASGAGPVRRLAFELDHGLHLGGVNHFQLLNHPKVYEQLRGWIQAQRAASTSPAARCPERTAPSM
jgi:pimeloyl-ACP methyl ester carboxylesterase